ncbi:MAG: hypothetical protein ABI629_10475 [bacterium]
MPGASDHRSAVRLWSWLTSGTRQLTPAIVLALFAAGCGGSSAAPARTATAAATATRSATASVTPTATWTATHSATTTHTSLATATPTSSATPSSSPTATPTGSATPSPSVTPTASETPDGFVPQALFRVRQLDYLRFATTRLEPGSINNAIAHMQRARIDPEFQTTPGAVPADAWDAIFTKLATLQDTRDFDALELVNLLYGYRDDPLLAPGLADKAEAALRAFKLWYTEPTPDGLIDESYYWTENHQVIYHAIEYLVGQRFPDAALSTDGRSGAAHQADARAKLLRWFDFRARYGFTEWHSNVYYQEDIDALLTLAEWAEEPEIQQRAAAMLDVLLFDLALHTFDGNFGATHGRSYKKDKMRGRDDDTWSAVKLLFDRSEGDYNSIGDTAATFFARAARYRLPEAIRRVAVSTGSITDRERMSLPLNETGPVEANPVAPGGYSFTDPDDLTIWWGMQALTAWPVIPLTVETINQYDLWNTHLFSRFTALRPFTADLAVAQQLAASLSPFVSFGLLKEVNTYHHRTADYLLSTAQDYRKGTLNGQVHAWQATFGADALVFTQHPAVPLVQSTTWRDDPDPGYWTGEASMPRSAQHENVAVHLYAPQYAGTNPPPLDGFKYEPYTHAYLPQDHFDEVVQDGAWTLARRGDGYLALYSWRPTQWIAYDPAVIATNGMSKPFDLRAVGGADNAWIVECGRAADWQSFAAFRAAIVAAAVTVTPRPPLGTNSGGFDVVYDSPSRGRISFGWDAPLTVDGVAIPIADYPRRDNPYSHTAYGDPHTVIAVDGYRVDVDFDAGTRTVSYR